MLPNIVLNNNSYILEHKKVEFSVQKCQVLLNNYYKFKNKTISLQILWKLLKKDYKTKFYAKI
jgi:hypothetical protein